VCQAGVVDGLINKLLRISRTTLSWTAATLLGDSIRRASGSRQGIHFLDCGRNGDHGRQQLEPATWWVWRHRNRKPAPGFFVEPPCLMAFCLHGSGRLEPLLKLVHNGIEFGMLRPL
jgi:hypothetical protein